MDPMRVEALAAAYGGDVRRWPEGERAAAERLLERDPALARRLSAGRALDAALDAWRAPAPSQALRTAVLERAPRASGRRLNGWSGRLATWASGAGLATAAVAGLLVGAASIHPAPRVGEFEAMTTAIYPDAATTGASETASLSESLT